MECQLFLTCGLRWGREATEGVQQVATPYEFTSGAQKPSVLSICNVKNLKNCKLDLAKPINRCFRGETQRILSFARR